MSVCVRVASKAGLSLNKKKDKGSVQHSVETINLVLFRIYCALKMYAVRDVGHNSAGDVTLRKWTIHGRTGIGVK